MYSFFQRKIFIRIYAGLLLVCLIAAFFVDFAINIINDKRIESYRENMATSTLYLVAEGVARNENDDEKRYWLEDASSLFGAPFSIIPLVKEQFNQKELERLSNSQSVVHYDKETKLATVYHRVFDSDQLVTTQLAEASEQQVRAMSIFLLDDLSHYQGFESKKQRLAFLSTKFPFPMSYQNHKDIEMDDDQLIRLRRNEVVIQLGGANKSGNYTFNVLIPTEMSDVAIILGPIQRFNLFPLQLVLGALAAGLLIISLGVYILIYPLDKRLKLVQMGMNEVNDGNLGARLSVRGKDEISQVASTFNSMTAHIQRLIESQRELTRAVSHELRTPVARIRFAVEMMADTDDVELRQTQKEHIDEDIDELNNLIDEILTYAKLEEGSPKLDWEMVDLKALVNQVIRETNALGKPISVASELHGVNFEVEADAKYIHRVVQNLVSNALRYANKNIIVSAGVKKGEAFVSVEDDGYGIAEADRDKVFIPFTRLDDSRTRSTGGYGLGLSIVSRIAFWFNGDISVDDSPILGGARFTMTWPKQQLTKTIAADEMVQEHSEKKLITDTNLKL
ncbi:MAG: two-component sensor histidine kinase [Gammaproteobacteria bacterium]|nr:MAG: two-component sensor histidine kinase [Gammaproteobacteria bacterium]